MYQYNICKSKFDQITDNYHSYVFLLVLWSYITICMYFGDSITVLSVLSPGDGAYKKTNTKFIITLYICTQKIIVLYCS